MAEDYEDEFSYERDIAPINRRFFDEIQRKGLPPKAMLAASRASRQMGDEYYSREVAIRKADMELASSNLRMQADMMNLEKVRRESANERLRLEQTQKLVDTLFRVGNDPSIPNELRPNEIRRIGIAAAPIIANNEGAKEAFNNALEASKPIKREGEINALDYLKDGDSSVLFEWAKQNNIALTGDTPVPFGVYALGVELKEQGRQKEEISSLVSKEKAKMPLESRQKTIDRLEGVTPEIDDTAPEQGVYRFKNPADSLFIRAQVEQFGTPEQKANFSKLTPLQQIEVGFSIAKSLKNPDFTEPKKTTARDLYK